MKYHPGLLINPNIGHREVLRSAFQLFLKVNLMNSILDPQDETSSSSENSPSSLSRKSKPSYASRKSGKSAQSLPKRHVRSSSGYSSHNEETTFRYVQYSSSHQLP